MDMNSGFHRDDTDSLSLAFFRYYAGFGRHPGPAMIETSFS
jgi:hypothetical protein